MAGGDAPPGGTRQGPPPRNDDRSARRMTCSIRTSSRTSSNRRGRNSTGQEATGETLRETESGSANVPIDWPRPAASGQATPGWSTTIGDLEVQVGFQIQSDEDPEA